MIVKYRKSFFTDLGKIKSLKQIQEVEFITEFANTTSTPEKYLDSKYSDNTPA